MKHPIAMHPSSRGKRGFVQNDLPCVRLHAYLEERKKVTGVNSCGSFLRFFDLTGHMDMDGCAAIHCSVSAAGGRGWC